MPSKHSPRMKRPPSPYSVSQSPRTRTPNQQRVWRSLSSTGEASSTNTFAEKQREMWLKSLRQGADPKRSPMKGNHSLNTSLSSSSDYLRDQMGLPKSARHRRRNSFDSSLNSTGSPQFKSPEDMYDEIISLKKTLVVQKNEYDSLKTKTRRLEEDNQRKEKQIQQLLDPKASGESIRRLAEGGRSGSDGTVTSGLKQKILKLEKQVRDKDNELTAVKSDIKLTDMAEMKSAMELYYQEVLRLREIISSQEQESIRLSSSLRSERDGVPTRIKALRKNVVQLTAENHQLREDNTKLRRDLDSVLNDGDDEGSDSENEGEIKYSALGRVELVTMVKKLKTSASQKADMEKQRQSDEVEKLKGIISRLKGDKNDLREENKKLKDDNERVENDLDKQTDKVSHLRREMETLKEQLDTETRERSEYETYGSDRLSRRGSDDDRRSRRGSESARRASRSSASHGERKRIVSGERRRSSSGEGRRASSGRGSRPMTADRDKAASAIQRQWREHRNKKLRKDDDIVALQSALRGHLTRSEQLASTRKRSPSRQSEVIQEKLISEASDSDDEVVYVQSAMRGHLERREIF